jgi:hypothetical protein
MIQIGNGSKFHESLLMLKIKAHFMLHHVTCYKKNNISNRRVYDSFGCLKMYPKKMFSNYQLKEVVRRYFSREGG